MLNLNLLPPTEQKNYTYELYHRAIMFFGFWFSVVGVIFGVLTLPAYFFISLQESEVSRAGVIEEASWRVSGAKDIEDAIRLFNDGLRLVLSREEKKRGVTPFVSEIFSKSPAGVAVSLINLSLSAGTVNLSGNADTRNAFLEYINNLRKIQVVKNVSSPVTNIIRQENITFSLGLKIEL